MSAVFAGPASIVNGRAQTLPVFGHIDGLLDVMIELGIGTVWMSGPQAVVATADEWWRTTRMEVVDAGRQRFARRRSRHSLTIMQQCDTRWPFGELEIAAFAAVLDRLNATFDVAPGMAPGTFGLGILSRELVRYQSWIAGGYPLPADERAMAPEFHFTAAPARPCQHVLVVDTNSAYLSAARNSEFGAGEPKHLAGTEAEMLYDPSRAPFGLWRLSDVHITAAYASHLDVRAGWYPTGTYRLVAAVADHYVLHEAFVYPEQHRAMRSWGDRIWAARQAFASAGQDTEAATCKSVAVQTIGMLAHRRAGQQSRWFRPDWRAEVVAQNTAKQMRTMTRLEAVGIEIVGVYADAIAMASPNAADLEAVAHGLLAGQNVRIGTGIGSYKVQAWLHGADAEELLAAAGGSLRSAAWFGLMHRIAEGRNAH